MILSHRHRFIFLKTAKTAGTSVEIALSRFCGAQDVISPLVLEDEELRQRLGYRGAQMYLASGLELNEANVVKHGFFNHMPAARVRELAPDAWAEYFRFCVVRNPWDMVVSLYHWRQRHWPNTPAFSVFAASKGLRQWAQIWRAIYTLDGRIAVDRVCRYENLAAELEEVRARVGIADSLVLPRAKDSGRTLHYRDFMTAKDAARIGRLFKPEIEAFGYRF